MDTNWKKPQLIALVRGTPEERVLVNCKTSTDVGATGPVDEFHHCVEIILPQCVKCDETAPS